MTLRSLLASGDRRSQARSKEAFARIRASVKLTALVEDEGRC